MSIPVLSFPKIRIKILVIAFLIFCFFIGLIKNVFAEQGFQYEEATCKYVVVDEPHGCMTLAAGQGIGYITTGMSINSEGKIQYSRNDSAGEGDTVCYYNTYFIWWDKEYFGSGGGYWYTSTSGERSFKNGDKPTNYLNGYPVINKSGTLLSYNAAADPTAVCEDDTCFIEKYNASIACGGEEQTDFSNWSDETCTGATCIVPCQDEMDEAVNKCGSLQLTNFDNWSEETCSGYECRLCPEEDRIKFLNSCPGGQWTARWDAETCTGYCDGFGNCSKEKAEEIRLACGARGVKWTDAKTCEYECYRNCADAYETAQRACGQYGIGKFDNNTCEYACDECPVKRRECQNYCSDKGGVYDVDCAMSSNGIPVSTCTCGNEVPKTPDSLGKDLEGPPEDYYPKEKVEPGEENITPVPDAPDGTDNQWLEAIKKNLDSQNTIANDLRNTANDTNAAINNLDQNQKTQVELLHNIAENINTVADNTSGNDDGATSGDIAASTDRIEDSVDRVNEELDEMSQGQFRDPGDIEEYTTEEYDFGSRTTSFLNNMKGTGLFSLPSALSQAIPSGGNPVLTISTGETFGGDHTIDYTALNTAFAALGTVLQIVGMMIGIRIVTLKR